MHRVRRCGIGAASLLALVACGDRMDESAVADAEQPTAEPAPLPAPPPPTRDEQLRAALADLSATPSQRGVSVTMPSAQFAPGSVRYDGSNAPTLDRVVDLMRQHPETRVVVVGHTDSRGDDVLNERLSMQRAEAVRSALVERGIDPSRIDVDGAGEAEPVASNDTEAGRRQNRRVELVFPQVERLAGTDEAAQRS